MKAVHVGRIIRGAAADLLVLRSALLWILLGACAPDEATAPDAEPIVSSIEVWPCSCISYLGPLDERTIGVLGTSLRFGAAALAQDGTALFTSASSETDFARFSWSSTAPDVATVEVTAGPFGGLLVLVTALREGTATITAATSEGVTGKMVVNVRDHARLAWSVPLDGRLSEADIAIGTDGTIYVVTFDGSGSRWVAVSPQGAVLWALDLPDSRSAPAIGLDGTLYGGLSDGGLVAVNSGGAIRWTLGGLDPIHSSPAIGADGTIYVAGHDHVYGVDPEGEIRWTHQTADRVFHHSSPAVANDGTVYVGGKDGVLYAIDPDGALQWTFPTEAGNIIYSGPVIARDGTIYFGSLQGLYAVRPDGSGGERLLDRRVPRSPSIGMDGAIFVGAGSGFGGVGVYGIDPGGSVRWSSMPGTSTTPVLGADGTAYVTGTASGEPVIAALDSRGRFKWEYVAPGGPAAFAFQSPAIGVDGAILAVSRDPVVVYAIVENASGNGGYGGSPWPTSRGNRANNGRAGG